MINWLTSAQTLEMKKFGYYSKPLNFNPKGKVIALNNNGCYEFNFWLVKDRFDPGAQIEWLEKELKDLESAGGFALIIAHIPLIDCLHEYGVRMKALMERY